jgi:hypothetical protein
VVIDQLDFVGVSVLETKNDAPVGADGDGPKVPAIAFELVEAIAGKIESLRGSCGVEQGENVLDFVEMVRPDPAAVAALVEAFKPRCLKLAITRSEYSDNCHLSKDAAFAVCWAAVAETHCQPSLRIAAAASRASGRQCFRAGQGPENDNAVVGVREQVAAPRAPGLLVGFQRDEFRAPRAS